MAAYNIAIKQRTLPRSDTLQALLDAYQATPKFRDLAERARADYVRNIRVIEEKYGTLPIAALPDPAMRGDLLDWRDKMAERSRRQADYVFATLAAILAWAKDRGKITVNPCTKPGKVYKADRAESIWTLDDENALRSVAPARIWLAYMLAVWTGQRQGDLLRLNWTSYDGLYIRLRQSKTQARVTIPVGAPLRALFDTQRQRIDTILSTEKGTAWTGDGFRTSWRKTCEKAGIIGRDIKGPTFHDIRGTAVTRLAIAGCSVPEIATITGHSLKDVEAILDAHYLRGDGALADSAMRKLEAAIGNNLVTR